MKNIMLMALISVLATGCVAYRDTGYYDSRDHGRWNGDRGYRGHENHFQQYNHWDDDHHDHDHDRY